MRFPSETLRSPKPGEYLHAARDGVSVRQQFSQVLGAQDVPQRGLGQQTCGVVYIGHISHRGDGAFDPEVDHSIHTHRHRVPGQDLPQGTEQQRW